MTSVRQLRYIAESILKQIEGWDDNDEIYTRTNNLDMSTPILETMDGFIECDDIQLDREDGDDDYFASTKKSISKPALKFNDMVKAQRVPTLEEDKELSDFANNLKWALMGELPTLEERINRFTPPTHPARYERMKEAFDKFQDEYIKCVDYYASMVMYHY